MLKCNRGCEIMNYVFTIKKSDIDLILDYYGQQPVIPEDSRIMMIIKNDDITLTIYQSFKAMIQGKNAYDDYLMWSDILGFNTENTPLEAKEVSREDSSRNAKLYHASAIGSDEVGTGDFFGPVVVCAAYVNKSMIATLETLKIRDSKKLTDDYILSIGDKLKTLIPHSVLVTDNKKYNELTQQGFNMNKIKAYLHNHAIKKCMKIVDGPIENVIVDQFCSPKLYFEYLQDVEAYRDITFLEKAEDQHLSVACASIIARYSFILHMNELNKIANMVLPFGAGAGVDAVGQILLIKKGLDFLPMVAKMNFKNMERINKKK